MQGLFHLSVIYSILSNQSSTAAPQGVGYTVGADNYENCPHRSAYRLRALIVFVHRSSLLNRYNYFEPPNEILL